MKKFTNCLLTNCVLYKLIVLKWKKYTNCLFTIRVIQIVDYFSEDKKRKHNSTIYQK
jgi:hypothetical protein